MSTKKKKQTLNVFTNKKCYKQKALFHEDKLCNFVSFC